MRDLKWIREHREWLEKGLSEAGACPDVNARFHELECASTFDELLRIASIRCFAPADASRTGLPTASVDCHFSVTTLEHVEPGALDRILREGRRVLKPDGVAIHIIDLSDHFAHTDSSISAINFLRFTDSEWQKLADNPFSYCNRLRASDYAVAFSRAGLEILDEKRGVDADSLTRISGGFPISAEYAGYSNEDLCTTGYEVVGRRVRAEPAE